MENKEKRFGIILPGNKDAPGGNLSEFPELRRQLKSRGVKWWERSVRSSTIFWLYESELSKLPKDVKPFIPGDGDTGHGVCRIDDYLEANPGEDIETPNVAALSVFALGLLYEKVSPKSGGFSFDVNSPDSIAGILITSMRIMAYSMLCCPESTCELVLTKFDEKRNEVVLTIWVHNEGARKTVAFLGAVIDEDGVKTRMDSRLFSEVDEVGYKEIKDTYIRNF